MVYHKNLSRDSKYNQVDKHMIKIETFVCKILSFSYSCCDESPVLKYIYIFIVMN